MTLQPYQCPFPASTRRVISTPGVTTAQLPPSTSMPKSISSSLVSSESTADPAEPLHPHQPVESRSLHSAESRSLRSLLSVESRSLRSLQSLQTVRESLRESLRDPLRQLRDPLSRRSSVASNYTVREIYGDASDLDIRLRRTATRTTILDSLLQRAAERGPDGLDYVHDALPASLVAVANAGEEYAAIDPELVTWDGPDDPANPRNWPNRKRVFQTGVVALYLLLLPMLSLMLSPAMDEISAALGITKPVVALLCVLVMVLAWALGPLVIAPMLESDRIGRRPVLNVSIFLVAVFNLGCGFARTPAQLCVMRFLGGLGGCAPLNVGAGTLADMWRDRERQFAMAAYSLGPTLGPVLAPVISSFIVTALGWHWCFYVLAIFNVAVAVFGVVFFEETYAPRLLAAKAQRLRAETGNPHLHTIYQIASGESPAAKLAHSVLRPVGLIVGHPMVFGLGLYMAFTYGFMYLCIVTFPSVFKGTYGFSTNIAGLMYLPFGIGFAVGTLFWLVAIERIYSAKTAANGGVPKPEFRLPCLCFSGFGIPVGLVWYGWLAQNHLHWIMPCIGLGIFAFSLVAVFQTVQNYLIDMNNRFAALSVAAAAVFRSFFGFSFPLFADAMYDRLHYGWGNTMCAFIAIALGVPFPVFCLLYGERLRLWANRRFEEKEAARDKRNLERLRLQSEKEYMNAFNDEPDAADAEGQRGATYHEESEKAVLGGSPEPPLRTEPKI